MARRTLVTYATKSGSTREIAAAIADVLRTDGLETDLREVSDVKSIDAYQAVIVGSAVYFDRWRPEAKRFLRRFGKELSFRPVWLFQDGPLESDFDESMRPLPRWVLGFADRIGVVGSVTFGGKLVEAPAGPIAHWIAKDYAGDYRDFAVIEAWAHGVAKTLGGSSENTGAREGTTR